MLSSKITELVTAVVITPSGENAYSISPIKNNLGYHVNVHGSKKTDMILSLNYLKDNFPNLKYVALEVNWFSTSTNIVQAKIVPKIESKQNSAKWKVSSFDKENTLEVSKDFQGNPNYSGTPSDESMVELCKYLKDQGYKILLSPILYVDDPKKSWRGMIKSLSHPKFIDKEIKYFFENDNFGYNKFILHYSRLLKDSVDIISIGYELKGITQRYNEYSQFPGIKALANLSQLVKELVSSKVAVTYIANFGEYHHSDEGKFPMDLLWKSINIITIKANFPLADKSSSCKAIKESWSSGEGWDYFISEEKESKFDDPIWAWKNFKYWYNNYHYEGEVISPWIPNEKPLFIIYDSRGDINTIVASEIYLKNQDIVSQSFLSYFDSRPYPLYPSNCNFWSDCLEWYSSSAVNGKVDKDTVIPDCI